MGETLWTDYKLYGEPASDMAACGRGLNDHRLIEVGPPGSRRPFTPRDAAARHAGDRALIEAELARPFDGPTVVVTHHGPHRGSLAIRFVADPISAGFVSDLGDVILDHRPTLWIHGHVHDGFDYRVGATRIIANPKGYGPKRRGGSPENATFDAALVVEAQSHESGSGASADLAAVEPSPPTIESRAERSCGCGAAATGTSSAIGSRIRAVAPVRPSSSSILRS